MGHLGCRQHCPPRSSVYVARRPTWQSASRAGLTIEDDPIRLSCTDVDAQARAPERKYLDATSNRRPANVTDLSYVSSRIVAGGDDPTCGGHDSATGRHLELRPPHFGSSCAPPYAIDYSDPVRGIRARRRARFHRPTPAAITASPIASHRTDGACSSVQSAKHKIGFR
jgi:hypothetical protein